MQGMLEGVLDVSWTCDQSAVLGAGNDKSIRVWDPLTGRARHTMTGHTGKVKSSFLTLKYVTYLEFANIFARKVHISFNVVIHLAHLLAPQAPNLPGLLGGVT